MNMHNLFPIVTTKYLLIVFTFPNWSYFKKIYNTVYEELDTFKSYSVPAYLHMESLSPSLFIRKSL